MAFGSDRISTTGVTTDGIAEFEEWQILPPPYSTALHNLSQANKEPQNDSLQHPPPSGGELVVGEAYRCENFTFPEWNWQSLIVAFRPWTYNPRTRDDKLYDNAFNNSARRKKIGPRIHANPPGENICAALPGTAESYPKLNQSRPCQVGLIRLSQTFDEAKN